MGSASQGKGGSEGHIGAWGQGRGPGVILGPIGEGAGARGVCVGLRGRA